MCKLPPSPSRHLIVIVLSYAAPQTCYNGKMTELLIEKIKTGKGLAGSTVALIYAPQGAVPGSLVNLTRFLNQQPDIRAVPGYHGPQRNHVLRVSGLKNEKELNRLLQQHFPAWQEYNALWEVKHAPQVQIAAELEHEPLHQVSHFPFEKPMKRFIKENANTLSGLSYMLGNIGLFLFSMRNQSSLKTMNRDWFTLYSSLAYSVSGAMLVAFGQEADNPRDVYSIMEQIYPRLKGADGHARDYLEQTTNQTFAFLRNHPWEVASLMNASGAASHLYSAAQRGRKFEGLAALGTLTATTMAALVPERDGRKMIDLGGIFHSEDEGQTMLDSLEQFRERHPALSPLVRLVEKGAEMVQDNPLGMSAGIQAVANSGYAFSALRRKPPRLDLAATSGFWLTGNYMQSQATKGRGPGFDDVVTAAAAVITRDPALKHKSDEEVMARIHMFAAALTDENEIVHSRRDLVRGIVARMERNAIRKSREDDVLTGFTASEKQMLKASPFVSPSQVEHRIASKVTRGESEGMQVG